MRVRGAGAILVLAFLLTPALALAHPAVTLRDRNGNPIKDELDMS